MKKVVIIFLLLSSTTCWALPQCRENNPTAWHACIGYGVWPNGDTYTGSFYNGKYSGHGTYTWGSGPSKGDKYIYYLSCYMTVAQIKEEIRNEGYQKAMFKNIVEEFK